jgi:hypothetical protein
MAKESVKEFFAKVYNDMVLQNELKAISGNDEEQMQAVIALAEKYDCSFSKDEFLEVKSQGRSAMPGEFEEFKNVRSITNCGAEWFCGGGGNAGMWGCFPGTWG